MKIKFVLLGLLISIIPSVFASLPLFRSTFIPTHDGEYHIIRFYEFKKNLDNGIIIPRWANGLNSGYGVPIFTFMYPLPNYIGVLLHSFGLSFSDAFETTIGIFYILAVAFCYFWLLSLTKNVIASTIGSVLMSLVPYWYLDMYIRGSIGEVMALAFVFILLFFIEQRLSVLQSLSLAGLVLSHNISAMMYIPVLFIYSLIRKKNLIPYFLGLLLSTYFWLPALIERSFVVGLNTVNYKDHFPELFELLIPSWGTGFSAGISSNKMSFQIGIIPLVLIFSSIVACIKSIKFEYKNILIFFLFVIGISVLLMLPFSQVIWKLFPILQYIQYPWRFLSFLIPFVGISGAILFGKSRKFQMAGIFLCFISFLCVYTYIHPIEYQRRDDLYYLTRSEFTDGTSSMGNTFSTIWSGWKSERSNSKIEFITGIGTIENITQKLLSSQWYITTTEDSMIRINTLYYPGWNVLLNNTQSKIDYSKNGTIDIFVPKGRSLLDVRFLPTTIQKYAVIISISSLSILLVWSILRVRYEYWI
jgi:hypothetical protein